MLLISLLFAGGPRAWGADIDNFEIAQSPITSGGSTKTGSMAVGERDLLLSGGTSAQVQNGAFTYVESSGAPGSVKLVWDGVDGDADATAAGLNLDLTADGNAAFLLGALGGGSISATLMVNHASGGVRSISISAPASGSPNYITIPFSAFVGTGDFTDASAIELSLSSTSGATVALDFLRTTSGAASSGLTGLMTDVLLVDADGNGKASPGDTLRYVVTIKNNSGVTKTGVDFAAATPANTTGPANLKVSPVAHDDGPSAGSAPGDPFHGAMNTAFSSAFSNLMANDYPGEPAGATAIAAFGGGSFGGSVDANAAGATSAVGGHILTVSADGSFSLTPATGFVGSITFQYRLANPTGSDVATATVAIGARPAAAADSYAVTGNTMIDTGLGLASPLSNDSGNDLAVISNTSPAKGTVAFSGSHFTYLPSAGASGADSFSYVIQNGLGSSTGTVSLTISADRIWYVEAGAAAGGDGRSSLPFNSAAALATANTGASAGVPGDNDTIFLRGGTYSSAVTLRNGQKLIGDGWVGTFASAFSFTLAPGSAKGAGVAIPALSGSAPVIGNASGVGVAFGNGNTVRGVTVGATAGYGYSGTSVGNLTVQQCSKSGATGAAISITTGNMVSSQFNSIDCQVAGAINLNTVTGVLNVDAGTISGGSGTAINIVGGSVTMTNSASITQASANALVNVTSAHSGTLVFKDGVLSASNGSGLQFNNADGTYLFSGTTTLNGGDAGIDISNGSSGVFTFGSGVAITNPTGHALFVGQSAPTMNFEGSLSYSGTASSAIFFQNLTGGTLTVGGTLESGVANANVGRGILVQSCAGTINFTGSRTLRTGNLAAISLTSNSAAINFTGGNMEIATTSGAGFSASNGGTITVQGSGNTIATTTGTPLNVASSTIGAANLNFQSISCNGAANAVLLSATGTSGRLVVTGTGSNGSGGSIQNVAGSTGATSGNGIYVANGLGPSLSRVDFGTCSNSGIYGSAVTGLTLNNCRFTGATGDSNAAETPEGALTFAGLVGTASISNCTISGGYRDNISVINSTGTLSEFRVANTTIGANSSGFGEDALHFEATGGAMSLVVTNSTFTSAKGDLIDVIAQTGSTVGVVIHNNSLSNAHGSVENAGGGVIVQGSGTVTYSIADNEISGSLKGHGLQIAKSSTGGTFTGTILRNEIGLSAVALSGAGQHGAGLHLSANGPGAHTLLAEQNTIRSYGETGIAVEAARGNSQMNVTLLSNTVIGSAASILAGLSVATGLLEADRDDLAPDLNTLNLKVQNNTLQNSDPNNVADISVAELNTATTINLTRPPSVSSVVATVLRENQGNPGGLTVVTVGTVNLVDSSPTLP